MATRSKQGLDAVEIRQATRADLLAIYRIEKQVFDQPWPYPAFEKFLGEPNFLVAVTNDRIVGYVVADTTPNAGRDIGHIKNLAVHPAAQSRGLGRGLLQRAILGLAVNDAYQIKLEVREGNTRARNLYREEGFEPAKRIPRYYDDGEAALVLIKGPESIADFTTGV